MAEEYDDFEKQLAENRTGLDIFQIKSKLGLSQQFSSTSSSSGIEQESLPTVSSSVGATRVRHTQM
jgi:hypothetical protein